MSLAAAGAGVAVGPGAGGIVLANQNGAVLTLSGRQTGLIVAAHLNGMGLSLQSPDEVAADVRSQANFFDKWRKYLVLN